MSDTLYGQDIISLLYIMYGHLFSKFLGFWPLLNANILTSCVKIRAGTIFKLNFINGKTGVCDILCPFRCTHNYLFYVFKLKITQKHFLYGST